MIGSPAVVRHVRRTLLDPAAVRYALLMGPAARRIAVMRDAGLAHAFPPNGSGSTQTGTI